MNRDFKSIAGALAANLRAMDSETPRMKAKRLVIECDGRDWHLLTPEQAEHDRRRDRHILAAGWPTMRFTGFEIYKSPEACASEVADYMLASDDV